jgi:glucose-1-phosphate adenylyltransferase
LRDQFVTVVPPQMQDDNIRFRGTADAVFQSINLLRIHRPDLVAVFGADHIYRMDVRQMVRFHHEHEADVTVASLPVPIEKSTSFGIVDVDAEQRIQGFAEKPVSGKPLPGKPSHTLASMGNYLFRADVLLSALEEGNARGETDFGRQILPRLMRSHRLYAYDFCDNQIPGIKPYEEIGYWRDIGTIDAYFDAHRDVLGREPHFDTFNPQWPIYSSHYQGPLAHILGSHIEDSLVGNAAVLDNVTLRNSIIRREAVLEPDVELDECIIMDYVRIGRGSRLRRVIVDRHNEIAPGTVIGYDLAADQQRYHVTPQNVVVVPKGRSDYFARDFRGHGLGYDE